MMLNIHNNAHHPDFLDVWLKFYHDFRYRLPGPLLAGMVAGSRAYNIALPTSDWDFAGVYVPAVRDLVSLRPPKEVVVIKSPNATFYSIRQYSRLLQKGNPGALEMLHADNLFVTSPDWDRLREIRHRFLSIMAVKRYTSWAKNHIRSIQKAKQVEKCLCHIARLVLDAYQISTGDGLTPWKDGPDQEFLLDVRRGQYGVEEIARMALATIDQIDKTPMHLPQEGDEMALLDWMYGIWKI